MGSTASRSHRALIVLGYLGAALASFLPPLLLCLVSRRSPVFLRAHAAQALNAALTTALYVLCSAIVGGLLAADSLRFGLQAAVTCAMFCWLVTCGYLMAAAVAACRGRFYQLPGYLCAPLVRPAASPTTASPSAASAPAPVSR
jgi:uncharacterized Tic20 family protein